MPDREWVRSDRRAENPGNRKEKDELRFNLTSEKILAALPVTLKQECKAITFLK